ncbi:MAG: SGNH/GDSL hydrolase family protein [bacterium]|nr:SGNH/GDSL hydrolase family protein [bacterium]
MKNDLATPVEIEHGQTRINTDKEKKQGQEQGRDREQSSTNWKMNLLLTIAGILVFFILAEIGVRVYTSVSKNFDIEMLTYAKKLKRRSTIPGLSHEHIPGAQATIMRTQIKLNSSGFRGNELPPVKGEKEHRILVLGSSITIGWGVTFEQVFTTLLEKQLNADAAHNPDNADNKPATFTVINSGIANYNTTLESIYLRERLYQFKPDTVVLHYFINDAEIISPGGAGFFVRHSQLVAILYNRIKQAIDSNRNNYKTIGEYYRDLYKPGSQGWREAQKAILEIDTFCKRSGMNFMVLLQPDLHDLSTGSFQEKCHDRIKAFLNNNGIPHHDLMPAFRERFGEDPAAIWVNPDDSHPTADGHQLMFEGLYNYIKTHFFDSNGKSLIRADSRDWRLKNQGATYAGTKFLQ